MEQINSVNYVEMKQQVSEIWDKGGQVKRGLGAISKEIQEVGTIWTGNRCNNFIKEWNANINSMSTYLKFLQFDLAVYLGNVAQRFSKIDENEMGKPGYGWGSGLSEINLTDETNLRFITSDVVSFQERLTNYFTEAASGIDELLVKVKALPWDSTSSEAFLPVFDNCSAGAREALEKIHATLNTMIEAAIADATTLEGQSTKEAGEFGAVPNADAE